MTPFERIMLTIQGKKADRPPAVAVVSVYGAKLLGVEPKEIFCNSDLFVKGQQLVYETIGLDAVWTPLDAPGFAEAFGGEIKWFSHQVPNVRRPAAQGIEEALKLSIPQKKDGRLPLVLEATQKLSSLFQGKVPIFAPVPGITAFPALLMGLEAWMDALLFQRDKAHAMLEKILPFYVDWCNTLLENGATAIVFPESMASAEIFQRDAFCSIFLDFIKKSYAQIKGPIIFHHGGGHLNHVLDVVSTLPNVVVVVVSSKDFLKEARQRIPAQVTLAGNIDNLAFSGVSAKLIETLALQSLSAGASSGPFILSNSGADIPLQTPVENLKMLVSAATTYAAQNEGYHNNDG